MSAPQQLTWTEANQRLLAAEFAALRRRLGEDGFADELESARAALAGAAAIDTLTATFDLSVFERGVLLLAAGVEMDARLAVLCGEARGRPQQPWATFGLALAVLSEPHWSALAPVGALRRWRLVEVDDTAGLTDARLRIDERILHHLAGVAYLDPRLQPLLRPLPVPDLLADGHRRLAEETARALIAAAVTPLVQLTGDDPEGQRDVAAAIAGRLGTPLFALAAEDLPATAHELAALATLWRREAVLSGGALLVIQRAAATLDTVRRFAEQAGSPVLVAARDPFRFDGPGLRIAVDKPSAPEQRQLWRERLGDHDERLGAAVDAVASQYRLSARTIAVAADRVGALLAADADPEPALWRACREVEVARLDALAQRLTPTAGWDELVLPEAQLASLRRIAAGVRHRLRVHHDWGFAARSQRGLGLGALFTGESGTGKTMAAEVLARELDLELYRIDLSAVVSKYIGETEKNLRRVFDAAEESGAILLFDEADALFGKRSEVKDSHDRYANIEVSYLLQRMEAYRGLAILTTNLKGALDTAFQRRLRFVVTFPHPDAAQREAIWRGIFPAATPLAGLDWARLARLDVAGGNIRNIALDAAFLAAEEGRPVSMSHLLRAARSDAARRERSLSPAETRGWT